MKWFLALAIIFCVSVSTTVQAEKLKSIPVEDQGPGKGGKNSDKGGKK